ncbi:UNVERIFIED_CONTAM: hypothetical protein NCL1_53272 [Trichonephila clavipes]
MMYQKLWKKLAKEVLSSRKKGNEDEDFKFEKKNCENDAYFRRIPFSIKNNRKRYTLDFTNSLSLYINKLSSRTSFEGVMSGKLSLFIFNVVFNYIIISSKTENNDKIFIRCVVIPLEEVLHISNVVHFQRLLCALRYLVSPISVDVPQEQERLEQDEALRNYWLPLLEHIPRQVLEQQHSWV